jgi:hypothetical protein
VKKMEFSYNYELWRFEEDWFWNDENWLHQIGLYMKSWRWFRVGRAILAVD